VFFKGGMKQTISKKNEESILIRVNEANYSKKNGESILHRVNEANYHKEK